MIGGDGPYEGCLSPTVDLRNYDFKSITDKTVKPKESFVIAYVDNSLDSVNR